MVRVEVHACDSPLTFKADFEGRLSGWWTSADGGGVEHSHRPVAHGEGPGIGFRDSGNEGWDV